MAVNPLIFKNAEKVRDSITESQKKDIAKLYNDWADEVGKMAKYYAKKTTLSAPVSERYYRELQKQLKTTSQEVSNEVYKQIKNNMYIVSDSVIADNVNWLKQFGFSEKGLNAAFSYVPDSIVRSIVTGQVYESGWSLSDRIWGNNEQIMKDLYRIVAGGVAQQMPIYDISKQLEQYVRPSAAKQWNLIDKDGKKIYPRQVDYNAQRLARTLVQHSYQQSFDAVCHNNPFVIDYVWNANGSRVCEICMDRDGKHYPKDALPLDHPNGMCTMEPNVDDNMSDKLVEWFNSEDGIYPEIDEFAKNFGYDASQFEVKFSDLQQKYLAPYGFTPQNMPKNFDDWSYKISFDQATEILNSMGTDWGKPHPYQQLQKYYEKNLAKPVQNIKVEVKKAGPKEKKVKVPEFTYWQNKYLGPLGYKEGDILPPFDKWYDEAKYKDIQTLRKEANKLGMSVEQFYNSKVGKVKYKYKTIEEVKAMNKTNASSNISTDDTSNWISLVKKNLESEMLAKEDEKRKLLTIDESNALERYTGSYYTEINGYLRKKAAGISVTQNDDMDKLIANMSSGLKKMKLDLDLFVCRGTDVGDLAGLFMTGDFSENYRKLSGMSAEELNNMFQGAIGEYAGFTSTSSLWDRGFSGDVEIVMRLPEGIEAQSIMRISSYGTAEGETLLDHGMRVKCLLIEESDRHQGSRTRVFLDIIPKEKK